MRKFFRTLSHILDKATYFLPHVLLGIGVYSIFVDFGEYDMLISVLLFISYLAISVGEYYYMKYRITKEAVLDIVDQINGKEFITLHSMLNFVDLIEETFDDKLDSLREEIKGETAIGQMDSEDSKD